MPIHSIRLIVHPSIIICRCFPNYSEKKEENLTKLFYYKKKINKNKINRIVRIWNK